MAANNEKILFVSTKKQASDVIAEHAKKCGQFYVNHRWLGGMLTNWKTVSASIKTLAKYEEILEDKYSFLSNPETQTSKKYEAFTRSDYKNWNRWTFYFCGVFLLPLRFILAFGCMFTATIILYILSFIFGVKDFSKAQPPLFVRLCKLTLSIFSRIILFLWGYFYIQY